MPQPLKICYFGLDQPRWARDLVYLKGLKNQGAEIIECVDSSRGLSKYWRLLKKHRVISHSYDLLLVGYLSNLLVPLAKLVSKKKVVYNALCSKYESIILDRQEHGPASFYALYFWLIDWLAFKLADLILVESEAQKKFLIKLFWANSKKFKVVFTGADNAIFHPDEQIKKFNQFTVVFRGWFLPATGVEYVIEAARILEPAGVKFMLIGRGAFTPKIGEKIVQTGAKNIELITEFLSDEILRAKMLAAQVCLGQFAKHPRLDRTIQNKTFESLALRLPYVTRDSASNREILQDNFNCLFTRPADAADLAAKIMILKNDPGLSERLAEAGYQTYLTKLSPRILGEQLDRLFRAYFKID